MTFTFVENGLGAEQVPKYRNISSPRKLMKNTETNSRETELCQYSETPSPITTKSAAVRILSSM